jgi:hypothetical protein
MSKRVGFIYGILAPCHFAVDKLRLSACCAEAGEI